MVFLVGESLARSHNDRVAGVDSDRVKVFHVADGYCGVVRVADNLVFNFLIALDALFNKHLMDGREREGVFHFFLQLFRIVGKAAARTAQGERRT